jgi:hypothetical protein
MGRYTLSGWRAEKLGDPTKVTGYILLKQTMKF